jgi:hypothetical protein
MAKPLLIEVAIRIDGKPSREFSVVYYKMRRKPDTNEYLLIVPRAETEIKDIEKTATAAGRIGKKIDPEHKYLLANVTLIEDRSVESWAKAPERPEQPFGSKVVIHADSFTDLEKKGQRTLMAPCLPQKKRGHR